MPSISLISTDLAMLLGAAFLLIVGGGKRSLDAALVRREAASARGR